MAFNGNYIKIETVIADIKKYPFTENLSKRDASYKLVQLIGLSGISLPLEKRYRNIEIKAHKGELPKDIIFIKGVNNKGNSCGNDGIPMRYTSDINHSVLNFEELKDIACGVNISSTAQVSKLYPPTADTNANTVTGLLWGDTVFAPAVDTKDIPVGIRENSYNINAMSIDTSFAYGWVELIYNAIKTDEEGFPMIPDNASFKEAFKYYLLKSYAEPAFYRGDVQRHIYSDMETQYNWYIGQAQSSIAMLSPDQAEEMVGRLIRIIPRSVGSSLN